MNEGRKRGTGANESSPDVVAGTSRWNVWYAGSRGPGECMGRADQLRDLQGVKRISRIQAMLGVASVFRSNKLVMLSGGLIANSNTPMAFLFGEAFYMELASRSSWNRQ